MNLAFQACEALALCTISAVGPGLWLVGGLRWPPLERLCGALLVSLIATYLAGFALFCLDAPPFAYRWVTLLFALLGCCGWRQIRLFFSHRQTRAVLLAFIFLLAWDFLQLSVIRNYSGAAWAGDWFEHYDRMRYFLHRLPDDYQYLGLYSLPARPPMMNIIQAFICRQTGISFEAFSLVSLFLNAIAFILCCLLPRQLPMSKATRRRAPAVLLILFMLNPSIVQNVTYTWTKALSAGLVVLGVCYYLRGLRQRDSSRRIGSALAFGAACLVHYSAIPFTLAVVLHYAGTQRRSRRPLSEWIISATAFFALLSTWFAWSIQRFGWHATMLSNTTATESSHQSLPQFIHKIIANVFYSLIPNPTRRCV